MLLRRMAHFRSLTVANPASTISGSLLWPINEPPDCRGVYVAILDLWVWKGKVESVQSHHCLRHRPGTHPVDGSCSSLRVPLGDG